MSASVTPAPKPASFIEGGQFICSLHDFTTTNRQEWDKHCSEKEGHYHQGTAPCVLCKTPVFNTGAEKIPHIAFAQIPGVLCDNCKPIMFPTLAKEASFKKSVQRQKMSLGELTPEEQLEVNQAIYGVTKNSMKFSRNQKGVESQK